MPQLRPPTGGVGAGAVPSSQACLTGGPAGAARPAGRGRHGGVVPRLARRARQVVEFAARADGVPFMVEELRAAALWSGALVAKAESWRVRERAESMVPRRRRAGGVAGGWRNDHRPHRSRGQAAPLRPLPRRAPHRRQGPAARRADRRRAALDSTRQFGVLRRGGAGRRAGRRADHGARRGGEALGTSGRRRALRSTAGRVGGSPK